MTISDTEYAKHVEESMKLDSMGYVQLIAIRITPKNSASFQLYMTDQKEVEWQGIRFESFPFSISGYGVSADGEQQRPKLSLQNPEGLFSRYIHEGWMNNAEVIRYRVLSQHLEQNVNSFIKHTWRASRVMLLNRTTVAFELRSATDGHQFILPGRQFLPPEYPQTTL